jgi:hypothetical protein
MIGDHQQLQPRMNTNDIKLAPDGPTKEKYQCISLFEQLINQGIPHESLEYQRRMKPKFAQFLQFIYPNYKSHPSVEKFSSIQLCEMTDDMIMFDHHEPETRMISLSYINVFEA